MSSVSLLHFFSFDSEVTQKLKDFRLVIFLGFFYSYRTYYILFLYFFNPAKIYILILLITKHYKSYSVKSFKILATINRFYKQTTKFLTSVCNSNPYDEDITNNILISSSLSSFISYLSKSYN